MPNDHSLYRQGFFGPVKSTPKSILHGEFGVPPFSILDAKDGHWQSRKRRWLRLGIESELGRPDGKKLGYGYSNIAPNIDPKLAISTFDPVLCELAYRWWCPPSGRVLDPFAGGSVRGIVAGVLGRRYLGIDLRAEQVMANQTQAETIQPEALPKWLVGDCLDVLPTLDRKFDFVLTCPPYGNLERYSDDPADLSTMEYKAFLKVYTQIIRKACSKLKDDSFACFVVASFRDANGFINDLPGDTTTAFHLAGLELYNDAILETAITSASMRARRVFNGGRKLTKVRQNVLVYVKGDPKQAAAKCKS